MVSAHVPRPLEAATVPAPEPLSGRISGYTFNDLNSNKIRDTGEKGLSGWTVWLTGISRDGRYILKKTYTDANGLYKFDNIPAGIYRTIEKLKSGFVSTGSYAHTIRLATGMSSADNNFAVKSVS